LRLLPSLDCAHQPVPFPARTSISVLAMPIATPQTAHATSSLTAKEVPYDTVDGKWVTFRAGGKPGRRAIRQPGEPGWVDTFDRIPIIDFTNVDHPDIEVRKRLAQELADAAENCGFWYAANTPVSKEFAGGHSLRIQPGCTRDSSDTGVEQTFAALEEFFALPLEEKKKCSWVLTPGCRGYESFEEVAENEGNKSDSSEHEHPPRNVPRSPAELPSPQRILRYGRRSDRSGSMARSHPRGRQDAKHLACGLASVQASIGRLLLKAPPFCAFHPPPVCTRTRFGRDCPGQRAQVPNVRVESAALSSAGARRVVAGFPRPCGL
jgi:hypothetical protein